MATVKAVAPRIEAIARALGSGEPLALDTLRAAPLKSLPMPSRLDAPIETLRGAGPRLAEAAAELGLRRSGICCSTSRIAIAI